MPQSFVTYHGCSNHCYTDGTRKEVIYHCIKSTSFPFWKQPKDATNTIAKSTRAQLKIKPLANKNDIFQYQYEQTWKVPTANYYIPNTDETVRNNLTGDTLIIDETKKPDKKEQITKDT